MLDNLLKTRALNIMWWPINQECVGCIHKINVTEEELIKAGLLTEEEGDDCIRYHASKCALNIYLGKLGTQSYECPSNNQGQEN